MELKETIHTKDLWIRTILGVLYNPEYILAQAVTLESQKIVISFRFPEYKKVISSLGHVSANQIHEAIMEGTYIAIGIALSQGRFGDLLSFDDFLASRSIALYREISMKFKKQIFQGEDVELIFWITDGDIKDAKGKFSTATVHFSGFVEGQSKSCLQVNDFIQDVVLKKQ